MYYTYIDLNMK